MKIQFMSNDNKIIYCDDDVLKITKDKQEKQFNVNEVGKVEIEKGIIYFYDLQGKCFDTALINEKEHKSKVDKMIGVINTKDLKIDETEKIKIKRINKIGLIATVIIAIIWSSYLSWNTIIEPKIINDTIGYNILNKEIEDNPVLNWCKFKVLVDENSTKEEIEKVAKKLVYETRKENKNIQDILIYFFEDERDLLNSFATKAFTEFTKENKDEDLQKFKGFNYNIDFNNRENKEKATQEEIEIYFYCLNLANESNNDNFNYLFKEASKKYNKTYKEIEKIYTKVLNYKMI